MAAIRIEGLQFCYPSASGFSLAINDLEVASGECVAIVGPSGCGKTTLLNLVAGILVPDSGDVAVGGESISSLGESARRQFRINRVGLVFQAFELLEYLNVTQNTMLSRIIDSSVDAGVRERAVELLAGVGLADKSVAHPEALSHGERQRVAVCRAMLNRPELLLADEPTGNLDASNKQNVVDLLIRQAREQGSTLLMVTHDRGLLDSFERVVDFADLASQKT